MGKQRGDYTGIYVIGQVHPGERYVLEEIAERIDPDRTIDRVIKLHKKWNFNIVGGEKNQFQEDIVKRLKKRLRNVGFTGAVRGINNTSSKYYRIEDSAPSVHDGTVKFPRTTNTARKQLEQYPATDHDDAPDAFAACLKLLPSKIIGEASTGTRTEANRRLNTTKWGRL